MVSSLAVGKSASSSGETLSLGQSTGGRLGLRLAGQAVLALSVLAMAGLTASTGSMTAYGQSAVTGGVSGVVTDASGAAVPGAQVIVTDTGTDAKQTVVANGEGRYTVGLLKPGTYKITATSAGLKSDTVQVAVLVGTTVPGDIKVTPTGDTQVVDVSATTEPLLDTQNVALITSFNEEQIQNLPTPGGDVTTVAFTLPGVVVNAGGSYGNFSSDGLPGISNLFVLNGFDNQDPFLNLNNSGSSNLTLGQGELAEASVVQNGYNSQYGRAAGAVINYTTKSGSNKFHGQADYSYNGTVLNANGWFNQFDGQPRPHAVSNQWAVNAGGPIIRDKVFFFADFEGLRYVLPGSSGYQTLPAPALQTYILGNVPAASLPFMTQALAAFNKSPILKNATPVANGTAPNQDDTGMAKNPLTGQPGALGCGLAASGGLDGTPAPGGGTFGVDTPCLLVGSASVNNINKEWLFTGRSDWNISDKHKIYGRYKMDRGSQPTSTSFIDPLFSAVSIQPEYEGQFNDSYVIKPNMTNVLVLAANWYSAYFGPVNPAASYAELPIDLYFSDYGLDGSGVNSAPGLPSLGVPFYLTQGRDVTQYQVEDDYSWIIGKHSLKLGANFRRDLVSDYDSQEATVFPYAFLFSLGDFANGGLSTSSPWSGLNSFSQAYTNTTTAHLALYNLGLYFQDEFQATSKLKLTMGVRIDRTGNPVCHNGCFSNYSGAFPSSSASLTTAYGAAQGGPIQNHEYNPFPTVEAFNFQPRFGFNFSIDSKTEIRAGAGLFSDLYPAAFVDGVIQNFPNYNIETVYAGALAPNGAGTVGAFAAQANNVVQSGFASGASVQSINSTLTGQGVPFSPPSYNAYFPGTFRVPEYLEYSMQIQRQISRDDALILTYAGNYGYNEVLQNPLLNASQGEFCNTLTYGGNCTAATSGTYVIGGGGTFGGLNTQPADPRFSRVNSYTNNAHSNYNGLMVALKHNGHGLSGQVSYTYSHSLDMVSNGGEGEGFNAGAVGTQITPSLGSGNLNYSNSDYDVRNNVVGELVYTEPYKSSNRYLNPVLAGWVVGFKGYARSGEPFTVTDTAILGSFPTMAGTTLTPQLAPGVTVKQLTNLTSSHAHLCPFGGCLNANQFVGPNNTQGFTSQTGFGDLRRNALFGPHYDDADVSLLKNIVKTEGITLQIGANAYNVLNHVNFAPPSSDVSLSNFGETTGAVAPPTSPYGSFQGAAVTQRLVQVHGKITF